MARKVAARLYVVEKPRRNRYGAPAMLGVFDSGVGGLTVLREIRRVLPDLSITYLGDNARAPYGDRSQEVVTSYVKECCTFLFEQGCTLIILACNTASAEALRALQQEWLPALRGNLKSPSDQPDPSDQPGRADSGLAGRGRAGEIRNPKNILGVIRPLAEEAVLHTKHKRIAVVGTRRTVESQAYVRELTQLLPDVSVLQEACPLLVPLVEEGWTEKPETNRIVRSYLRHLKTKNPDVLILGCTHYEALHPTFQRMMGKRCTVLHSPVIVAEKLKVYLERHPEYEKPIPRTGKLTFLTTGSPIRFREAGERFFGRKVENVQQVRIPGLSLAKGLGDS